MTEWLGALGLAWPRLLIYPGGVFALLLAWVLDRSLGKQTTSSTTTHKHPSPILVDISAVVLPLILISLLPLPLSGFFGYTPDLVTALVLVEWPLCLVVARMHTGSLNRVWLIKDFWHAYLMLILSMLVLVQINASFRLDRLTNMIDPPDVATYLVWLVGMVGWWAALVPLVGRNWLVVEAQTLFTIGGARADHQPLVPSFLWHEQQQKERISVPPCLRGQSCPPIINRYEAQGFVRWGMRLRGAGHVLLACLPIMGLIQGNLWLAMILLAGMVAGVAGATRYHQRLPVRQKQIWRTSILVALVLVLGWETYMALVSQLM